jgi:hypothetical protein
VKIDSTNTTILIWWISNPLADKIARMRIESAMQSGEQVSIKAQEVLT